MIEVCGVALGAGWVSAIVGGLVLGSVLFAVAAGADWVERRYERRETVRRLRTSGHAHRWLVGDTVNGQALGECVCGAERVFVEGA